MTPRPEAIAAALRVALDSDVHVERIAPLGGGSISDVSRVQTTAGSLVVKGHADPPPGLFEAEAAGLKALRASNSSLVVPRVIAVLAGPPAWLVLEDLGAGVRARDFDDRLGYGLAELHRTASDGFGFDEDNYCGATPQPNPWTARWVDFYRESRLGHQVRLAARAGLLSAADERLAGRLLEKLDTLVDDPDARASLVHGDLWSGNLVVAADGRPALVDPAPSYSHREAELGMMTLFGGFSARVMSAYEEAWPLAPGWRERNGLYQLYHVLNHLNLFGAGYHQQAMALVRRYV
jgi:fructosamine-3-kinase